MTARAEYTDAEWALLQTAPVVIGLAVAYAEPGGMARELIAAVLLQGAAAQRHPDNELLKAVWAVQPGAAAPAAPMPATLPAPGTAPADLPRELLDSALDAARNVVALLEERSSPLEAEGFRTFLGDVAVGTAQATRTGGFLGVGGVRVTAAERAAVDAIREALGLGPMPADGEDASQPAAPDTVRGGPGIPTGPINPA